MRGVELIPTGCLEGMPAVKLTIPVGAKPEHLTVEFVQRWQPGVRIMWLCADDWADPALDTCLAHFQSDSRTHDVVVWAQRDVLEVGWPATPLWGVVDASGFLSGPTKLQKLAEDMARAAFIPQPTELLVCQPSESNLTPGLLDQIATNYDPERGAWIELTDPSDRLRVRAIGAACAAAYGWGVRTRAS